MVLLAVGLVALAIWIVHLVTRLNLFDLRLGQVERRNDRDLADDAALRALAARVAVLEARARAVSSPAPDRPSTPPIPPPITVPPPAVVPVSRVAAVPMPAEAAPPVAPRSTAAATVHTEPATPDSDDAWEVTVGANWLNKVGAFVFVIGLALLVGYSMAHVGPAGRIAIGYVVSLTLLVVGVVLERRADYRIYAHGLMAGGWAGIYFTTYAMRAVDAARVLDSDLVAIVGLLAVAAGMVWHSLRYRSQELTALAFIVAYATLALTPLRGFSLVASVPLALSVLVVAQRFAWPGVQILGIVCTYGLYILRGQVFGFGDLDPTTFTPYVALAVYWVIFEAADFANLSGRTAGRSAPAPLFLLNAAGLVGAALLQLPMDTPIPLSTFLMFAGVAYVASAMARARLGGRPAGDDALDAAARGSYQGASALAVALVTWAIELRFGGSRRTVALLMEAELLFLSGLILRDWLIRGLGSAVAIAAGLHAMWALGGSEVAAPVWSWADQGAVGAAALTAALWYANRETLRSRQIQPLPHEWVYTPVATCLVALIARADLSDGYSALAVLVFALPLIEAGVRRGREYLFQSYVAGGASALVLLGWFVSQAFFTSVPTERDAWFILSVSAMTAYLAAWRLVPRVSAAATAGAFGTAFIVVLQSIVIAPEYVAVAWAGTAAAIGAAGLWSKKSGLRWQAYPLLILALFYAMGPVLAPVAATATELASALTVIGLLYAGSLAVRGALTHAAAAAAELEDSVRMALSIAASLALIALIYSEVRPNFITVTWGVQGAALLALGFPFSERLLRLSGLAVLLACIVRLFVFDLPQLEALARIISFVALGAVLLAVSWFYTRYRARIRKYL